MAACPWCNYVVKHGFLGDTWAVYCTSPLNPGNSVKGDQTQNGVSKYRWEYTILLFN